ncbi:MAG TPA: sugar transferase [Candidatus Paceibacterota bacterium]|nr:sugar transferase [Candidatus Paceibacterota bacterium]
MTSFSKKAPWLLLLGDVAAFAVSLWLSLLFRYLGAPDRLTFFDHFAPFSLLFIVWTLVFFISGLYDKQSIIFAQRLKGLLVRAQIVNILVAVSFFYFIPWYGITPKTTLFFYLLISLGIILAWRTYGYFLIVPKSRERAILIGGGEMGDIVKEAGDIYNLDFVGFIDPSRHHSDVAAEIERLHPTLVIADLHSDKVQTLLPSLYNLIFSQIRFIDADKIYEDVFDRIPLSLIRHHWFLENVSTAPKVVYDALKRVMDISIALLLGSMSLVAYPFIGLAIKVEDCGPIFIFQKRIGKDDRIIRIAKFRSMSVSAQDETGASKPQSVTRVGAFIRKTRIDELPQLWSVVKGDLSLIGPRPELPQFVKTYESEIPFYKIRHLIKPGLSGWAQIYHKTPPKFSASKEDTAMKLSYDLYYVKNRSFLLDLMIALKTLKELVSRKGV